MDKASYEKQMQENRKEIDSIDSQLITLLVQRMGCSEKVAKTKLEAGMPVFDAVREKAIIDRVKTRAGEYGHGVASVYAAIIAASRARQYQLLGGGSEIKELEKNARRNLPDKDISVVCQGVYGAYSHTACRCFFGDIKTDFKETFQETFEAIKNDEADFAVLPVENSAAGAVTDVYKLIFDYRFYIVGETAVKVRHCLAVAPGTRQVNMVVSHPQALAQCAVFIKENGFSETTFSNTAAAAQYVAEELPADTGAICSVEAAKQYNLKILKEDIQDTANNTTRFVLISKTPVLPAHAEKISLCFSVAHEAGTLYNVLARFASNGLSLTKIESKPIPESNFEYDFYLDFTGNIHDKSTLDLICALHDELPRFSFLGNYSETTAPSQEETGLCR